MSYIFYSELSYALSILGEYKGVHGSENMPDIFYGKLSYTQSIIYSLGTSRKLS